MKLINKYDAQGESENPPKHPFLITFPPRQHSPYSSAKNVPLSPASFVPAFHINLHLLIDSLLLTTLDLTFLRIRSLACRINSNNILGPLLHNRNTTQGF